MTGGETGAGSGEKDSTKTGGGVSLVLRLLVARTGLARWVDLSGRFALVFSFDLPLDCFNQAARVSSLRRAFLADFLASLRASLNDFFAAFSSSLARCARFLDKSA